MKLFEFFQHIGRYRVLVNSRDIEPSAIKSRHIADKAVTREKMTDELINELRMIDVNDLVFGAYITEYLTNYYSKEEIDALLANIDVDIDLSDYVTTGALNEAVSALRSGRFESVAALPDVSEAKRFTIYLVPSSNEKDNNVKDEFIVVKDGDDLKWEQVGSTAIDLTGYATEKWVNDKKFLTEHQSLKGYATEEWVNKKKFLTEHQDLSGYAKTTDIPATPTFEDLRPNGVTGDDLSEELKNTIDALPTDATVGSKANMVAQAQDNEDFEDYVAVLKNVNVTQGESTVRKGDLKRGGRKLSELALKTDVDAKQDKIVREFSTEKSYVKGNLVRYEDGFYKFIKNHAAGAWNANDVEYANGYVLEVDLNGNIVIRTNINDKADKLPHVYFEKNRANDPGAIVYYGGSLYKLPNGHTVGVTFDDTEKEDISDHLLMIDPSTSGFRDSGHKASDFLTEHQSLAGYAKTTDIPAQVDISGKVDKIQPVAFDAVNGQYAVGQYVTKDSKIYRCKVAHNKAEWDGSHFDDVTNHVFVLQADGSFVDSGKTAFSGNYNDLTNKPTIPDVSGFKTQMSIEQVDISTLDDTILNVDTNKYYILTGHIEGDFSINLPKLTGDKISCVILRFHISENGANLRFTNTSAGVSSSVQLFDGVTFEPSRTYEVNCLWANNWIVTNGIIV